MAPAREQLRQCAEQTEDPRQRAGFPPVPIQRGPEIDVGRLRLVRDATYWR